MSFTVPNQYKHKVHKYSRGIIDLKADDIKKVLLILFNKPECPV